jgi:outer membrane protein assembly factor BamB
MLDPATGDEAWHYTRSNARLCGATAVDQLVVVLFSTGGRCNELTALRADTGERLWYRSVGFRADATLTSTDRIVLAVSPTGLATVDPTGNNVRWHHPAPDGCRFTDAAAGSAGVAVLQRCGGAAGAVQAVLLDGFAGTPTWTADLGATSARLAGADGGVDVVVGDELRSLAAADGSVRGAVALPAGDPDDAPLQTTAGSTTLVWVRGTLIALDGTSGTQLWSVPATGLPATVDPRTGSGTVLVPEGGALVDRDATTGAEVSRSTLPSAAAPDGARWAVVGDVVVASSPGRITALR